MEFYDGKRHWKVPPTGQVTTTDLASVPWPLWSVLAPYGRQLRPALLHDHYCKLAGKSASIEARHEADDVFRAALRSCDVPPVRATIFWTGVSFGRYLTFRHPKGFGLLALALLSLVLVCSAGASWLFDAPSFVGGVLQFGDDWAPALLTMTAWAGCAAVLPVVFGRDAVVALVSFLMVPIVAPAFVVNVLTSVVVWLPDAIWFRVLKALGRDATDPGGFRPTTLT